MSCHYSGASTKGKNTRYSEIFTWFGNISNLQNFIDRFEKDLLCGRPNCERCIPKFEKMKIEYSHFEDLAQYLNEFNEKMTGNRNNHFNVGMIPNNQWEITINDIDEYRRNSYNREKNKIQFDEDSLCVYNSQDELSMDKTEAYLVIRKSKVIGEIYIELEGKILEMGFFDRIKNHSLTYFLSK